MILYELTTEALDAAAPALGTEPVTMVNQLWFRPEAAYSEAVTNPQLDARSALYQGYVPAFSQVAQELGITGIEPVFVGHRAAGLVASGEDDWDDLVIVRYRSFDDFRKIVESEQYKRLAKPHHRAAVFNWRIIAAIG